MIDPQKFWRDPAASKDVSEEQIKSCIPSFYKDKFSISLYLVDIFNAHIPKGLTVLELGANCGRNLYYLNDAGYTTKGIEINKETQQFNKWGIDIAIGSIEDLLPTMGDNSYDVVLSQSVLMHLPPSSDWIFEHISRVATKYLVINEVENSTKNVNIIKWNRDYKEVFNNLGWKEIYAKECHGEKYISVSTTRVFIPK